MSAFTRRQPGTAGARAPVDLGTRPGLHGQVLISTGLAGLDRLLGGGLPLGTILLLLEDSNSQQHVNFIKCFMAEGVCCKHNVAWLTSQQLTPETVAAFLPDQARSSSGGSSSSSSQMQQPNSCSSAAAGAGAGTSGAAAPDDGLKIAWQYRKYIHQQQREEDAMPDRSRSSSSSAAKPSSSTSTAAKNVAAGIGREWCRQYDLTTGLKPSQLAGAKLVTCCCQHQEGSTAVEAAGAAAASFVKQFQPAGPIPVPSRDPGSIGRVVIQSLGSPAWWASSSSSSLSSSCTGTQSDSSLSQMESSMLSALADLRLHIQDATCAALVTCPASLYGKSFKARLQHLADAVLVFQCLADNTDVYRLLPDPTSASALLEVRRLPMLGLLRQRYTEEKLYLIRHKRRSISISVLDLLPLEAADQQRAGGSASQQDVPAVAKICGSGPGQQTGMLDF